MKYLDVLWERYSIFHISTILGFACGWGDFVYKAFCEWRAVCL